MSVTNVMTAAKKKPKENFSYVVKFELKKPLDIGLSLNYTLNKNYIRKILKNV